MALPPPLALGLRRGGREEAKGEKDRKKNGSAEAAHAPLSPSSVVLSSDTSVLVCGVWQWHQYVGVCGKRTTTDLKPRVGTDGEGRGRRGSSTEQTPFTFCPPPSPPVCASLLSGATKL